MTFEPTMLFVKTHLPILDARRAGNEEEAGKQICNHSESFGAHLTWEDLT